MANLTNPVASTASYSMIKSSRNLRGEGQKLATGSKGTSDIVDYVVGSKLQTSASVLRGVSKGTAYGSRMLNVAQNTLISTKTTLVNLLETIAQANTATGDNLSALNNLYKQGAADVIRLISSAEFDGRKLFDGSLASNVGVAASALMPAGSEALGIRVGELMNNIVTVSIPRLLTGDGTGDTAVVGKFTPLFSTTAETVTNKTNAVTTLIAVSTLAGAYADAAAAKAAVDGLGAQGNDIGNRVLAFAQNAVAVAIGGADVNGGHQTTQAAVNGALDGVADYIHSDAIAALKMLNNITVGVNAATDAVYRNAVQALRLPGNAIGDAIITAAQGVAAPGGGRLWYAQKVATLTVAVTQALVKPPEVPSNLLTSTGQANANNTIKDAINTVTSLISIIGGQRQILEQAGDDIQALINVQQESAGDYLNTNYEASATEFKSELLKLQGSIRIILQGFDVAEAALELVR